MSPAERPVLPHQERHRHRFLRRRAVSAGVRSAVPPREVLPIRKIPHQRTGQGIRNRSFRGGEDRPPPFRRALRPKRGREGVHARNPHSEGVNRPSRKIHPNCLEPRTASRITERVPNPSRFEAPSKRPRTRRFPLRNLLRGGFRGFADVSDGRFEKRFRRAGGRNHRRRPGRRGFFRFGPFAGCRKGETEGDGRRQRLPDRILQD